MWLCQSFRRAQPRPGPSRLLFESLAGGRFRRPQSFYRPAFWDDPAFRSPRGEEENFQRCVMIAAAVFGAIASVAPNTASAWIAGAATLASAVGAFLGRQVVGCGDECGWIQARGVAEGLK